MKGKQGESGWKLKHYVNHHSKRFWSKNLPHSGKCRIEKLKRMLVKVGVFWKLQIWIKFYSPGIN